MPGKKVIRVWVFAHSSVGRNSFQWPLSQPAHHREQGGQGLAEGTSRCLLDYGEWVVFAAWICWLFENTSQVKRQRQRSTAVPSLNWSRQLSNSKRFLVCIFLIFHLKEMLFSPQKWGIRDLGSSSWGVTPMQVATGWSTKRWQRNWSTTRELPVTVGPGKGEAAHQSQ